MDADGLEDRMKVETRTEGKRHCVSLSGELTVRTADRLKQVLVEAIRSSEEVEFEFHEVSGADLSLLQMFCAAAKTACTEGKNLVIQGTVPDMIVNLLARAGYDNHSSYSDHECIWKNVVKGNTS